MKKELEEKVLNEVYDLILNPNVSDEERSELVVFKDAVKNEKNFEKEVISLATRLRKLALIKYEKKETMSPEINQFYAEIGSTGLFEKTLAYGLAVGLSMWGRL